MTLTLKQLQARRAVRKKELEYGLKKITRTLKDMGALKIVLFGSYASGTIRAWSDLDVLAIMPSTKGGKEWFKEIYDTVDMVVSADILPFTEQELKAKMETSSFIRHAVRTGRVIYEKEQKGRSKKLVYSGTSRV